MTIGDGALTTPLRARGGETAKAWMWRTLAPLVAAVEASVIILTAFVSGALYFEATFGSLGDPIAHLSLGAAVAILFVSIGLSRGAYSFSSYLAPRARLSRVWPDWNLAFLGFVALLFLFKAGPEFSRGAALILYALGLGAVALTRFVLARSLSNGAKTGRIVARRLMVVGTMTDIETFARRYQPWNAGFAVVGACRIEEAPAEADEEAERVRAVELARAVNPDEIILLRPWSQTGRIERFVDALMVAPAAIHLGPEKILENFTDVQLTRMGRAASLSLVRPPLAAGEVLAKRLFDVVVSGVALIAFVPLFAFLAIAIKLDSKGPVFFRQTRHGFNQNQFRIFKFRSMTVMEDGDQARQATRGDARITRFGAFLRRTNLDELPQLINVLIGDMSIVGPRPHPLSLDRHYAPRLSLYARRHNVKPGITGWAQVNGLRGETDTQEKMEARLRHDLYYLDNWSLLFDIRICFLTVLSPRAFDNAG